MIALFKKELSNFFNSLIGYFVIIVFLLINSLILWVIPGQFNILESGYANLDSLFMLAPWIFMFLVPAVTMRMFADEKKTGTIEFILTKPISELNIILAKFLAGLTIIVFSLLPSLIYYLSVYLLGSPVGSIDTGGTWGSYIGLFFLAASYVSIGIFASSLTENQIISFLISIIICMLFYIGFETFSSFNFIYSLKNFFIFLGINEHYQSMSRGVIDSRDVIYFISLIAAFLIFTRTILESRKW